MSMVFFLRTFPDKFQLLFHDGPSPELTSAWPHLPDQLVSVPRCPLGHHAQQLVTSCKRGEIIHPSQF